MGLLCMAGLHKWDGCRCRRCGAVRDEGHDWNGCTCRKCATVRDSDHRYYVDRQVAGKPRGYVLLGDSCTCTICRRVRDSHHRFRNGVCEVCGGTVDADLASLSPEQRAEVAFCARYAQELRMQALESLDADAAFEYYVRLLQQKSNEDVEEPRHVSRRTDIEKPPGSFAELWLSDDNVLHAFAEKLSPEQLASLFSTLHGRGAFGWNRAAFGLLGHLRDTDAVIQIVLDSCEAVHQVRGCLADHPDRDAICTRLLEDERDFVREGACLALGGHVRDGACNCTRCGKQSCHEYVQTSGGGHGSTAEVYKCKYCGDTNVYFTDGW